MEGCEKHGEHECGCSYGKVSCYLCNADRIIMELTARLSEAEKREEDQRDRVEYLVAENKMLRSTVDILNYDTAKAEKKASQYKEILEEIVRIDGSHECVKDLVEFVRKSLVGQTLLPNPPKE